MNHRLFINIERGDLMRSPLCRQIRLRWLGQWQLTQMVFDDYFPDGSNTQENGIGRVRNSIPMQV